MIKNIKKSVIKKSVHDKLVAKVNNIDTSGFVLKTKYGTGKTVIFLILVKKQITMWKNRLQC